jgi:hypothetical protein
MTVRRPGELTPAAELALSEYLTDIREEILWRAEKRGTSFRDNGVVSVRDVVEATGEVIGGSRRKDEYRRRSDLLLRLYLAVSALMGLVGVLLLVIPRLDELTTQSRVALTLIATSAAVAASTFAMRAWLLERTVWRAGSTLGTASDARQLELADFVRSYAELEFALRDAVARHAGESASNASLSQMVHMADDLGLLPPGNAEMFRSLTRTRNAVVHGSGETRKDLHAATRELEALLHVLEHVH